jgi:perosamine synthetase
VRRVKVAEPFLGDEEVNAVLEVLRSGWLAHGPLVEEFERRFADYVGTRYAIAVFNGTAALRTILRALRLEPGDEVIVPCFTFIATANVVLLEGGRPVFADIELETYNIDPSSVLERVGPRTRAIIAVHLYGHPADMRTLREIATDYKLVLIEDAAQAHGARAPEGKVGSLGFAAAFSFYATKNMTTGEGGMITTNSPELAYVARLIRDHGQERKYYHVVLGENLRMTSIQAALGIVQLSRLDRLNEIRRRNARLLTSLLKNTGLILPREKPGYVHVYHQYVVRVEAGKLGLTRDQLARKLLEKGIETAIHYPRAIPDQPLYRSLGYPPAEHICPNAAKAAKEVLSLPVHPKLQPSDIEYIAEAVRNILEVGG